MFQNIPNITKNLLLINILAYFATLVLEFRGIDLTLLGGLHYFESPYFGIWQFLSYQFLHGSFTHLFFNMFALWMFGGVIERVWGPQKFLIYYLVCGIGAGLCQEVVQFLMGSYNPTIGASGAVYGILLAFGMTFPEERIFIFPLPIPIKAKWFVVGYAALELFSAFSAVNDGVAHMAHIGGMLFGLLLILYWRKHPEQNFNMNNGRQFFDNLKRNFDQRNGNRSNFGSSHNDVNGQRYSSPSADTTSRETDMEYNARKQQRQKEIDRILDKIRKSGYDSLTKAEKQYLFDASREQ